MSTQITDIIDVEIFAALPAVDGPEKTAFFESGIVVQNGLLNSIAAGPGKVGELPFWRDLDATNAPNLSNDDPSDVATPDKIIQGSQVCYKAFLNQSWGKYDLASELAMGPKAMDRIRQRTDTYWKRQWQRRLIATVNGVLTENIATDGGDMVHVAAGLTNADITANTVFTRENFTSSVFTLGDAFETLAAIGVHSIVYKRMVDNDDIIMMPDSQGMLKIPTYLGYRVIIDDSLPVTPAAGAAPGDAAPRFTSVLFGVGAFGFGEGMPEVPVEIDRNPAVGGGGGLESLWTRKTWILHPFGFKQNTITGPPAVPDGESFSLAELATAGVWSRVVERKNVPMAFLVTNG